jgi:hypothetical protein
MQKFVGCETSSWIPKARFERIFMDEFSSFAENVTPSSFAFWIACDVVDGNFLGSKKFI